MGHASVRCNQRAKQAECARTVQLHTRRTGMLDTRTGGTLADPPDGSGSRQTRHVGWLSDKDIEAASERCISVGVHSIGLVAWASVSSVATGLDVRRSGEEDEEEAPCDPQRAVVGAEVYNLISASSASLSLPSVSLPSSLVVLLRASVPSSVSSSVSYGGTKEFTVRTVVVRVSVAVSIACEDNYRHTEG